MKPEALITMTATIRPDILFQTLESFERNLFIDLHQYKIAINIDPVGIGIAKDVKDVVFHFFGKKNCYIRTPSRASFPEAFKWVWSCIEEEPDIDYVFNLEDDWKLLREHSLFSMMSRLEIEPDLALLRLPMFHANEKDMKNWNKFYPYNGKYYECPEELTLVTGFCGHPSLIRSKFVWDTATNIDTNINPEKQFHTTNVPVLDIVSKYRYGVVGVPGTGPLIKDIGREWLAGTNWQKKGNKAWFVEWELNENRE